MNDSSLKNTFLTDSMSLAPRRPQKHGNVQSIVRDETAKKASMPFEEIVLSDDEEEKLVDSVKCKTCSRDMTNWINSRRDIHNKVCKAKQADKDTDKKKTTKSKTLTATMEKEDEILEKPIKESQSSLKSWELSKNNVKFARIAADDEENRKRKRPRSFAVVELAPKKCQCEVLTTLHSRFIDNFHCKPIKNVCEKMESVTEHAFQMKKLIEKLSRYEQLSSDMQKTLDDTSEISTPIISICSSEGHEIKCLSLILKHRTSMIRMHPRSEIIVISQTKEVIKSWLTFVFTANIEWTEDEKEGVKQLANQYGPVGLEVLLNEKVEIDKKEEETIEETEPVIQCAIQECDTGSETPFPVNKESRNSQQKSENLPVDEEHNPVNYYSSDDPFIGFGRTNEDEETQDKSKNITSDIDLDTTVSSVQKHSRNNTTMDSFDEWSNQPADMPSTSSPMTSVTPVRNNFKPVFGSHVKILKTNDITPMPLFDSMDESELKERMKAIGQRQKGRKAMITILKKAYTTLHPEVCTGTPTIRPLVRNEITDPDAGNGKKPTKSVKFGIQKTKTLNERMAASPKKSSVRDTSLKNVSNDSIESDAEKTLNLSNDEREVGNICGDVIGEDEEEDEDATSSSSGKSDLNSLRLFFLNWLRDDQNTVLHEHILSLQPVSLEEMLVRLEKAEGPLGRIGKGKLVKILEMLKITYQLPQKPGRARIGGFKRKL
ncbi:hypothetical protein GCK72_010044 [Caenorhabditis remanei]|uniref:Uncharacterized protein n=1 Tax=Caenorhabditis remanei TaxID=31234 RepID=A0A6A5H278_CAERE|nr:hypothetical protein GCK72_010044 [Caenorhabditis remanei]KAF1761788.1 hypothetical protein GCK72_010044 [Caenorhabditis remanei]